MGIKLKAIIGALVLLPIGGGVFFLSDYGKGLKPEDNNYIKLISTVTKEEALEPIIKIRELPLAETVSQNMGIKRIDCVYPTQEDIELIGKMVNLKELNLSYFTSEIDLSPLGSLVHLEKLSLVVAVDAETDTSPLAGLQKLEEIYIEGEIDLAFLKELNNLEKVVTRRNGIEDLSFFQHMEKLEELDLHCVFHADFQDLGGLKRLRSIRLYISESRDNIGYLGNLSNLSSLYIESGTRADEKPVNLGFLKNLVSLRDLSIKGTGLESLGPISGLTSLEWLTLSNVVIFESKLNLEPIGKLENLRGLYLEDMELESAEPLKPVDLGFLKNLVSLRDLSIEEIGLESLGPISGLTSLENLTLSNVVNSKSKLNLEPIGKLENLRHLYLEDMELESVEPLRGLGHLERLKISGTDIDNKIREELELYLVHVEAIVLD